MCVICDGATVEELRQHRHRRILECGFALEGVEPGPTNAPWAYTVGLMTGFDHPELVVAGVRLDVAEGVLMDLGETVTSGARFHAGGECEVLGSSARVLAVAPIHVRRGLLDQWFAHYEDLGRRDLEPEALQVLLPEELLPDAPCGHRLRPGSQPRLDAHRPSRRTQRGHRKGRRR